MGFQRNTTDLEYIDTQISEIHSASRFRGAGPFHEKSAVKMSKSSSDKNKVHLIANAFGINIDITPDTCNIFSINLHYNRSFSLQNVFLSC